MASNNSSRQPLKVKDAFVLHGKRHSDHRGSFEEIYNESQFVGAPLTSRWQQVSHAISSSDVLRGLHCSAYAKFITVLKGRVFDVVVDLRPDSPTYLQWDGVWLDADDDVPKRVYIPKRCGHGYYCQRDSIFLYLQDGTYNPKSDIEMNCFDVLYGIKWPVPYKSYIISDKDAKAVMMSDLPGLLEKKLIASHYVEVLKSAKQSAVDVIIRIFFDKKNVHLVNGYYRCFTSFFFIKLLKKTKSVCQKFCFTLLQLKNVLLFSIRTH